MSEYVKKYLHTQTGLECVNRKQQTNNNRQ